MANELGNYNETFFAQEALIQLENVLGMASRIHRDYDAVTRAKGDVIQIRRPGVFTAANAPATAADLATESVQITLNQWKEVKFKLDDKELSLTSDRIISDHIRPAAVALAQQIDETLNGLYVDVPWISGMTATPVLADISAIRAVQFANKVPMNDGKLHMQVDGATEVAFLNAMSAAGQQANTQDGALRQASMGTLFGYEVWANQNSPDHTSGVAADAVGAVDFGAGYAADLKAMHIDGVTSGATLLAGDTFAITGHIQRYVLTADASETTGDADIVFEPGLEAAVVDGQVVTFTLGGVAKNQTLAFHRNAFALAMAPLSTMGGQMGAKISTITDPLTGLSLRARMYYVGDSSEVHVALDCLYGVKTLDRNLAVRGTAA